MRVAVTGASGFIGGHVIAYLRDKGHKVISVGRTNPKIEGVEHHGWGLHKKVNAVVHCASESGDWLTDEQATELKETNLALTEKAIRINPSARFILMSSASVYQTASSVFDPVEELVPNDTQMLGPHALSKALCEHLLANTKPNGDYYILRPRAVYGKGEKTILPLIEAYAHGYYILPGKNPQGSFTNVASLCEVVGFFVDDIKGTAFGIYNVADGSVEDSHELVARVAKARGHEGKAIRIPYALAYKAITGMESKARRKGTKPLATRHIVSQIGRDAVLDTSKLAKAMGYTLPNTDLSGLADW